MRKQTVWLLVVMMGSYFVFLVSATGQGTSYQKLLAQVGITVGVASNPYNTLDSQLTQKQDQLDREASNLAAQEAALASSTAQAGQMSPMFWYLVAAIAFIALLVGLNFYFDWRRSRVVPSDPEKPKE